MNIRTAFSAIIFGAYALLPMPVLAAKCSEIKTVQAQVSAVVGEMKQGQRTPSATVDEVERLLGTINGVAEADVQTIKVTANELRSSNPSAAAVEEQVKKVLARFAMSQKTCTQ